MKTRLLNILAAVVLGLSLPALAATVYPYFAPGGALSCTGDCKFNQSIDLTQAGFVSGPLRVGAGGIGVNTLSGLAKGNGTSAFTPASAADVIALWTGCSASTFLAGNGVCQLTPVAANPSGLIGLAAVNGAASTYDRSDSTHALDQSISPTWTGAHIFNGGSGTQATPSVRIGSTGTQGTLCVGNFSTCNSNPTAGDPAHTFEIVDNGGALQGVRFLTYAQGAAAITPLHWARVNGTPAAPTGIVLNDNILSIGARGYVAGSMSGSTLAIEGIATETWSGSALGSALQFEAIPTGTATRLPMFKIQGTSGANNPTMITNGTGNSSVGFMPVVDAAGTRYGYWGKASGSNADMTYESDAGVTLVANNGGGRLSIDTNNVITTVGVLQSAGSAITVTGTGGCATPGALHMQANAGEFTTSASGACVYTLTFNKAAPNGYACWGSNLSAAAGAIQTNRSTTQCVMTVNSGAASQVVVTGGIGY